MKVVSFLNFKGGIGKTTTVLNVGVLLARDYKKRVLLIDYDAQGNLSTWLKIKKPDDCELGVPIVLRDRNFDIHAAIDATSEPRLHGLACNGTINAAISEIDKDKKYPQQRRLDDQLAKVENEYDFVLIDCPPSSDDMRTITALYASQEVIIVNDMDANSNAAVPDVQRLIEDLQCIAPCLTLRGILFTRVGNDSTSKLFIECAKEDPAFATMFQTYIRYARVPVQKSCMAHMCVRDFNPKCGPAQDYDNFVAEYLGRPPLHEDAPYIN